MALRAEVARGKENQADLRDSPPQQASLASHLGELGPDQNYVPLWMSSIAFVLAVLSLALHFHDADELPSPPPIPPAAAPILPHSPPMPDDASPCSCPYGSPSGSELFGAELYPGAGRMIYVEEHEQGIKPAAVLHGDLVVFGRIINATAPPSLLSNAPENMAVPATRSNSDLLSEHRSKDWYDENTSTGRCGWWLGDYGTGGVVGYTLCENCTLREFEIERNRCCAGTNLCSASPSNASCARHGIEGNRAACESSGCVYLDSPQLSVNGTYLTRCIAAFNTGAVWSSRVRRKPNVPVLAMLAQRQRLIYDTGSDAREVSRVAMDRPVYFLEAENTLEITRVKLAVSKCSDGTLLRLEDFQPALDPNAVNTSFSDSGDVAAVHISQDWHGSVSLTEKDANVTDISVKLAGGDTDGFAFEFGSMTAIRTDSPPAISASSRRGVLKNTGKIHVPGLCVLITPHSSAPRPSDQRPSTSGCDDYANTIEACFAEATDERDAKHTECEARLFSSKARDCCVELYERNIFVECD